MILGRGRAWMAEVLVLVATSAGALDNPAAPCGAARLRAAAAAQRARLRCEAAAARRDGVARKR
jgi:hypothetical protein